MTCSEGNPTNTALGCVFTDAGGVERSGPCFGQSQCSKSSLCISGINKWSGADYQILLILQTRKFIQTFAFIILVLRSSFIFHAKTFERIALNFQLLKTRTATSKIYENAAPSRRERSRAPLDFNELGSASMETLVTFSALLRSTPPCSASVETHFYIRASRSTYQISFTPIQKLLPVKANKQPSVPMPTQMLLINRRPRRSTMFCFFLIMYINRMYNKIKITKYVTIGGFIGQERSLTDNLECMYVLRFFRHLRLFWIMILQEYCIDVIPRWFFLFLGITTVQINSLNLRVSFKTNKLLFFTSFQDCVLLGFLSHLCWRHR